MYFKFMKLLVDIWVSCVLQPGNESPTEQHSVMTKLVDEIYFKHWDPSNLKCILLTNVMLFKTRPKLVSLHTFYPDKSLHIPVQSPDFIKTYISISSSTPPFLRYNPSDPDPVQDFCIPTTTSETLRNILPCKNTTEVMAEDFVFSGIKSPGNFSDAGLSVIPVNPTVFPGLNIMGMSFARADLKVGGVNAPHFHPRATEISYVVQGRVYSGFVDSTNRVFAQVIEQGEVMVFPRGLVHFQMNIGKSVATVFGSFNSQNPGSQKIPSAVFGSGINDQLLEKSFGLTTRQIGMMRRRFLPKRVRN